MTQFKGFIIFFYDHISNQISFCPDGLSALGDPLHDIQGQDAALLGLPARIATNGIYLQVYSQRLFLED